MVGPVTLPLGASIWDHTMRCGFRICLLAALSLGWLSVTSTAEAGFLSIPATQEFSSNTAASQPHFAFADLVLRVCLWNVGGIAEFPENRGAGLAGSTSSIDNVSTSSWFCLLHPDARDSLSVARRFVFQDAAIPPPVAGQSVFRPPRAS